MSNYELVYIVKSDSFNDTVYDTVDELVRDLPDALYDLKELPITICLGVRNKKEDEVSDYE